jgi:ribose 5-phosphate isomerase B
MAIAANKIDGIRAAVCYDKRLARLSRLHNDANVLVLSAAYLNLKKALEIIDVWLKTNFLGGRHLRRIKQISFIEKGVL